MINIVIAIIAMAGTYAVLRSRVSRLELDYQSHIIDSNEYKKDTQRRLDAGFKRIDKVIERTTILERDTEKLLDLETAERKFITRVEMKLHLEKIELVTGNTNKELDILMGKQDKILDILNIIKDK